MLWSKQPDAPRRVASTIKMLNALVVRDHANLDDVITVYAQGGRSIDDGGVGLTTGQKLTVRQLLSMMLVALGQRRGRGARRRTSPAARRSTSR